MSVADQTPVAGYTGNGVTTAFSFPFTILAEGDVSVMVAGLLLTLNVHYTVSGVGGASGTVTFTSAPASLASIVIYRDSDLTRDTDYQDNGDLLAATLNRDLDRLWLCMQEILEGSKTSPRTVRAPIGETLVDLPTAATRAGKLLSFNSAGQPQAVAAADQSATQVAIDLALAVGAYVLDAVGDGVTDAWAAVAAADASAASAGQSLIIPPGTYLISAAYTFTARIIMRPGAKFKVTATGAYLKFGAGFEAGLFYCLDTDQPTQFLAIEAIYPQWFGATGLVSDDNSTALIRTFKAARGCVNGADAFSDARYGCATVKFVAQGQYRCRNVPVYCGTIIEGDWQGSLTGSCIAQIDFNDPGLLMMPKNYDLTGAVINNGVGQNVFKNMGFRTETAATTFDGDPLIYFMSPAQATTYLAMPGDTVGSVGHIDTMFNQCWFKDSNPAIVCDEGMLWVHIRNCTFDVCWRAIWHKGTARGRINSYNNIYYGCMRGAFTNESSDATLGVSWYSNGDEFKAGITSSATTGWRRAWNYSPTAQAAGTFIKATGSTFLRTDSLFSTRVGGSIFAKLCDTVDLTGIYMKDPDSTNNQKAIAIQDGVKHLRLQGTIISDSLANYTTSRLISVFQATQTLTDVVIDMSVVNTSASTIETALHADFTLTGVDMARMYTVGNFTNRSSGVGQKTQPVLTVASAGTIVLPPDGTVFVISGTTNITSITATGWSGRTVKLIFQGVLTLTDGGNLLLGGNFVTTADDCISLTCSGANWYQDAPGSVN